MAAKTDPQAGTENVPVPPQDLDAEEYVLGAMMLNASAIDRTVEAGLEAADFYRESHGRIYRAALSLHQLGQPVDGITVADRLEELQQLDQVGGRQRVHEIAALVPAASNVAHHARIIVRESLRRRQAEAGAAISRRAYESGDPAEALAEAQALLHQLADRHAVARPRIVTGDAFLADTEEHAVAAIGEPGETLLPLGGLLIMGGEGGASKTTLTLDGVAHMASGTPWLGYPIGRPLRILIIENEGPRPQFREKLAAKADAWEGPPWVPNIHVWEEPWARFSFANPGDQRHLQDSAADLEIDIVVADPLDSLGIEGAGTPEDVRKFIAMLKRCGLHNPIRPLAFWILHHFNKAPGGSIVQRLSGAWGGHPDAILGIELGDDHTTKLTWGKLRHATPPKDKTLILAWDLDTRGFHPIDKPAPPDVDELRKAVLDHVTQNPGQAQSAIENALHSPTRTRSAIRSAITYLTTEQGGQVLAAGPGRSPNGKYLYPASTLNSPLAEPLFQNDPPETTPEVLAKHDGEYTNPNTRKPAPQANSPLANTTNGETVETTPAPTGDGVLAARRPPRRGGEHGELTTDGQTQDEARAALEDEEGLARVRKPLPLAEAEQWLRAEGWMHDDPVAEAGRRFDLDDGELEVLTSIAAELAGVAP